MLNTGMKSSLGEYLHFAPYHAILGGRILCGRRCILCERRENPSYFKNWGKQEKKLLIKHLSHVPLGESSMCKKHIVETHRLHNTPKY